MAATGFAASVGGRAARAWAGGLVVAFTAVGAARGDREAIAFALLTLGAAGLSLLHGGRLGRMALGFIALDTLLWMAPAALANGSTGERSVDVALPALLSVLALGLLVLVLGAPPAPVLGLGLLLLVATTAAAAMTSRNAGGARADVRVATKNVAFVPGSIRISVGGTLAVVNNDLFWHTFTIPELDVDVRIPTGASRSVAIDAPAGTYRFLCAIPGHVAAGMEGTITVDDPTP